MRKAIFSATAALAVLALAAVAITTGVAPGTTGAADHLDAPLVQADGRTDINDVYVFHPGTTQDLDRVVLAMTVNPGAGVLSPTSFHAGARYELNVDLDGDAKRELTYTFEFDGEGTGQSFTVRCLPVAACGHDWRPVIAEGMTGATAEVRGGGHAFAGLRDDPFFFDLVAFRNGLAFCPGGQGTDFFLGLNVSAIVLELPVSAFGGHDNIGVWGTTRVGAPVDRMGRPAINTVFIPSSKKDQFNQTPPFMDQRLYRGDVVNTLVGLGNSETTANSLADVLLPDILTVDLSQPTAFLNGRALADDVIDAELALISGGAITTDCVSNDSAFTTTFPYLAAPN